MKRAIHIGVKAFLFIGIFLALNGALRHVYLRHICVRSQNEEVLLGPVSGLAEYDTLILGDSRAAFGVIPERFGGTLKVAALGEGYMVSHYKLVHALERQPWRTVLLSVGRHSFSQTRAGQVSPRFRAQFIQFGDLTRSRGNLARNASAYIKYRMFPYADFLAHLDKYLDSRRDPEGIEKAVLEKFLRDFSQTDDKLGAARRHVQPQLAGEWWNDEMVFFFERILGLCRERDVRVILVRYPVTAAYAEATEQLLPLEEFDARLQELLEDWPEVEFVDYLTLYAGQDELFADVDHLNGAGMVKFTERVIKDLGR